MPKQPSLQKILKPFVPLFIIAAVLPFLLFGVVSQNTYSLFSRADTPNTLRVWMEPSTIIAKQGKPVTITIMAALDKKETLLPGLSLNFGKSSDSLSLDNDSLTMTRPFGGQVIVGHVTITSLQTGKETITIPKESIQTTSNTPLDITTQGVTIVTQ